MGTAEANARVIHRVDVAPGLMVLRVRPEGWEVPRFQAGQFTVLGLPGRAPRMELSDHEDPPPDPAKRIARAYSAASSSKEGDYLEFYITLVRSGALTPRLFALDPGDPLWVSGKFVGLFTLAQVPRDHNILFLSTGTGLAPYMSMLRSHFVEFRGRDITVVQAARHSWDLGYRAELETMARVADRFTYAPVLTSPIEENTATGGLHGFIRDHWASGVFFERWREAPTPANTHVFLCGNPSMIEGMMAPLTASGFLEHTARQPGQIHLERYW